MTRKKKISNTFFMLISSTSRGEALQSKAFNSDI